MGIDCAGAVRGMKILARDGEDFREPQLSDSGKYSSGGRGEQGLDIKHFFKSLPADSHYKQN